MKTPDSDSVDSTIRDGEALPAQVSSGSATERDAVSGQPADPRQSATVPSSVVEGMPAGKATWNSEQVTLWLRRADQLFLGVVLIALVILLVLFRWRLSGGGRSEIEIVSQHPREFYYAIDINRASWVEWAQLEGIGEKLARRIVEDRQERGPFQSVEDINRVRGVGLKLLEKLRPFLTCRDQTGTTVTDKTSSGVP